MADNRVKFLRGTAAEYTVAEKDNDTIYFTTDDGKLYIGDKKILGGASIDIDSELSNTSENPVQNKVIKAELDKKANTVKTATVTLSADSWIGNEQTVSASIVTSDCVVVISPVPDSQDEYSSCGIKCTSQSDGNLSFICSSTPSSNIDVNVVTI